MVPGLEDRLMEGSEDDILSIAGMVSHSKDVMFGLLSLLFIASEGCI